MNMQAKILRAGMLFLIIESAEEAKLNQVAKVGEQRL